jgi:hypothetical protein
VIKSDFGHDGFLIEVESVGNIIRSILNRIFIAVGDFFGPASHKSLFSLALPRKSSRKLPISKVIWGWQATKQGHFQVLWGGASHKSIFSLAFTPIKLGNASGFGVRKRLWTIDNIASARAVFKQNRQKV